MSHIQSLANESPANRPLPACLVDLDGTLISANRPLPSATSLVELLGERWILLSNNAEHTPLQLSALLQGMGLDIPPQRIVLAGTHTLDVIAEECPGARILLLGSGALKAYARDRRLIITPDRPDIVVVARDRTFDYEALSAAANAVRKGALLVAANPDRNHPGPDAHVVPETGSLLAAVMACAETSRCRIIGKPEPVLFERALAILGVLAKDAVMIGDNDDTDGAGAAALGMRYISAAAGLPHVLWCLRQIELSSAHDDA